MKAIIMCGGFGTRLGEIAKNTAKPLLKIGKKPVVEYIIENAERASDVSEIIISTNAKFAPQFRDWLSNFETRTPTQLVVEDSRNNNEKIGAIGGINFVVESLEINDDILVINGDNIFDFEISDFVKTYKKTRVPMLVAYDIRSKETAKFLGVVTLKDGQIIDFAEKPANPKSTLVSTGCYIFPKKTLTRIGEYIREGNNKDAQGFFIDWLYRREPVKAFVHKGAWFDIGNKESLEAARNHFGKHVSKNPTKNLRQNSRAGMLQ